MKQHIHTHVVLAFAFITLSIGCSGEPASFPHTISALDGAEIVKQIEDYDVWTCVLEGTRSDNTQKLADELVEAGWTKRSSETTDSFSLKSNGRKYSIYLITGKLAEDGDTVIRDPNYTIVNMWVKDIE